MNIFLLKSNIVLSGESLPHPSNDINQEAIIYKNNITCKYTHRKIIFENNKGYKTDDSVNFSYLTQIIESYLKKYSNDSLKAIGFNFMFFLDKDFKTLKEKINVKRLPFNQNEAEIISLSVRYDVDGYHMNVMIDEVREDKKNKIDDKKTSQSKILVEINNHKDIKNEKEAIENIKNIESFYKTNLEYIRSFK